MKTIKIDMDTYRRLLEERRRDFWVDIPDELWDFVIPKFIPDLIRHHNGDSDPMTIVDNLAVNTEWCTAEDYNSEEKYAYMGYRTFADFCKAEAIAHSDKVAILHW